MARAHIYRPLLDEEGNLLTDAKVTVNEGHVAVPLSQVIYNSADGDTALPNPFMATNGVLDIWLDIPQRVNIYAESPGLGTVSVFLDALPPGAEIMRSAVPLRVTNTPAVGQVLVGTDVPGEAQWQDYSLESGLTAKTTVWSEAFATGNDPVGWTWTGNVVPFLREYVTTDVPGGQGYTYALRMSQTAGAGTINSQVEAQLDQTDPVTLTERGAFDFWAKLPEFGEHGVYYRARVYLTTSYFGLEKEWVFGEGSPSGWNHFEGEIGASSYRVSIEYKLIFTDEWTGTPEDFLITGMRFTQGGQLPPHYHEGTEPRSVVLGTGAAVTGESSVAVGDDSGAAIYGVAVGYSSSAGEEAVAVGRMASGGDRSIAVGVTAASSPDGVALGHQAAVYGSWGVAVGGASRVEAGGQLGVAVGYQSLSSGLHSVALGAESRASAEDSIALGYQAVVDATHTGSVAIGAGAVTTAANQVMLGTSAFTVMVPGNLRALANAVIGGAASTVGFFGNPGITRPTVANPGAGNATLLALMEYLHDLGLINLTGAT